MPGFWKMPDAALRLPDKRARWALGEAKLPPMRVPGQPAPWRSETINCKSCYFDGLDNHGLIHCMRNAPTCKPTAPLACL